MYVELRTIIHICIKADTF